jgi:hypothetical protein
MIPLKSTEETYGYEYSVCEVIGCDNRAEKVFMIQARYIEVCRHHHEDIENISFIS